MQSNNTQSSAPLRQNLRMLCFLRLMILAGLFFALFYFSAIRDLSLPVLPLLWVLIVMLLLTFLVLWRSIRGPAISQAEFLAHLLIDIIFLAIVLYLTGGASNPFVSYFLVPVAIAAITFSWRQTLAILLICTGIYSALLFHYNPVAALMSSHGDHINLHIVGMWLNFAFSALLIGFFVVKMARVIHNQERALQAQREKQMQQDQLMAVATLAAATAHELATPINSISLLCDEFEQSAPEEMANLKRQLKSQIASCRDSLQKLVETANSNAEQSQEVVAVKAFFDNLFEQWRILRPEIATKVEVALDGDEQISCQQILKPALLNLLNNAGDVSPGKLSISLYRMNEFLKLDIRDYGPGISAELTEHLGKPFVTTKAQGLGIGLFLAKMSLQQIGGTLDLKNCSDNGVLTMVSIPLLAAT